MILNAASSEAIARVAALTQNRLEKYEHCKESPIGPTSDVEEAALGARKLDIRPDPRSQKGQERANSNLAAGGAIAQARNAAFHSWRPILADQCQSQRAASRGSGHG